MQAIRLVAELGGAWKREAERRALIAVWRERQLTTMLLDDGSADRQSHSYAMRLCSEKGVKNTSTILLVYPASRVTDRNQHLRPIRLRLDQQCFRMARDRVHGFDAVHDQIQDYLLQLDAVARYGGEPGSQFRSNRNLVLF